MEVINTIGRRKTAIARIYMTPGKGSITVNNKDYKEYFPQATLRYVITQALELTNNSDKFDIKANLTGGGVKGQAEAFRLALARALNESDNEFRAVLKENGLMRRDPRMVERKKPGQKKARKKFQFSKR